MKIIITGCAGFIGINFTKYWLEKHTKDTVIGIDCLTYAANVKELEIVRANPDFIFYPNNICDYQALDLIFKKERPDIVINFAAESHVDRSIDSSKVFIETNVLGTQCLLDMCVKYEIKRFHQISTDEVYGDLPLESTLKFNELSSLKPSSPYSASKASADLLVLSYHRTHNLSVTISRSSNNYGKYQHNEKLIPHTIDCVLHHKPITIFGNGLNVRDWLFVQDHCMAVECILENGRNGEIYNIGAEQELTNLEVVEKITEELKSYNPQIEYVADRKGHDKKYSLDISKIRNELKWSPSHKFSETIKDVIHHYVNVCNCSFS